MTKELLLIIGAALMGIGSGIAIYSVSTKEKLTVKHAIIMVVTGMGAAVVTWTYLEDVTSIKGVVRNILLCTFFATAFARLIGKIISAFTNIPEGDIQKFGIDLLRKKVGLEETDLIPEDEHKEKKDHENKSK